MKLYVADLAKASVDECGVGALYRKRPSCISGGPCDWYRKRIERAGGCCQRKAYVFTTAVLTGKAHENVGKMSIED